MSSCLNSAWLVRQPFRRVHACVCVATVLFPPCTMLEVKLAARPDHAIEGDHTAKVTSLPRALSPKVLHERIEVLNRRSSNAQTDRFRVQNADEDGKQFISIEVLPHFL